MVRARARTRVKVLSGYHRRPMIRVGIGARAIEG